MNFAYHIEELFIIDCQFMGHMPQMILKCKEKTSLNLWIKTIKYSKNINTCVLCITWMFGMPIELIWT